MHTTARLDAAIYVESLSVIAGKGRDRRQLLAHLSTAIPESSFVSVIGASGCGKSTFLRALAGIQPISSGRVLLAGHEVQSLRQHLPLAVGYLPQFGAFHGDLTVAEILNYAVALRLPASVPRATREQWCQHIIDLARIRAFLPQKYRTLSGGQMRRIALAEELIGDPAFLLLDELTSGLDAYSEHELMVWLRELAHGLKKTVVLVTHAVTNLELCDSIIFLHEGRLCYQGPYPGLLETHHSPSIEAIFGAYQEASMAGTFHGFDADRAAELPPAPEPYALNTAPPPGSLRQLVTLVRRQTVLLLRDRAQLILQFILLFTFPALVALFGYKGLPQVERLSLTIDPNMRRQGAELIEYLHQSGAAAALVSGLSMFQVILLTLIGANNGAREIAKEREVLEKELRAGLSAWSYVTTKGLLIFLFSFAQAFWMTWFVKTICRFPGSFLSQFEILFFTTLAMSAICLAISSASKSPERASLLSIYLVGLQLPLSGAVLALPEFVSTICRPFIAAYWGWSGYLKTMENSPNYDIVHQSTNTYIADFAPCLIVLGLHVIVAGAIAWFFVARAAPSK
jgi:ABC-type multidrug transport system ATPase subunit